MTQLEKLIKIAKALDAYTDISTFSYSISVDYMTHSTAVHIFYKKNKNEELRLIYNGWIYSEEDIRELNKFISDSIKYGID